MEDLLWTQRDIKEVQDVRTRKNTEDYDLIVEMGQVKDNFWRTGKDLVSKIINGKTFLGTYPDRSQIKYTKVQAKIKMIFKEAAKFAADIVNDPVKKAAYKEKGEIQCITLR